MELKNIPILITSSVIAHDQSVVLKSPEVRLSLAIRSIEEWLKIDPSRKLVLCDGSNFDFSAVVKVRFPNASIESLKFENNKKLVSLHGRGYGEGEIVRYAIKNSRFIAESGGFAKCTSKLWVKNFINCVSRWNGEALFKGVFTHDLNPFKPTKFQYIDTRFYVISVQLYEQFFINAHKLIDKKKGIGLENCFHQIFTKHDFHKYLFSVAPVIYGVGGGGGEDYSNPIHRRFKESLRIKILRNHSEFSVLFN
jgi:hypothetical protein